MDNPLFAGAWEQEFNLLPMKFHAVKSPVLEEEQGQLPLAQLSPDESKGASVLRRTKSLSLSAREYEGVCRVVQENVCKSPQCSVNPMEDFKEFRQKLADLKRQLAAQKELAPNLPPILTPTGSLRSLNLGSVSARSQSLSRSQPTSPLKRLSVLTSRSGRRGLNPLRDSHWGAGAASDLSPSRHRLNPKLLTEKLYKMPSAGLISPLFPDHFYPLPSSSDARPPSPNSSKRSFSARRRAAADSDDWRIPFIAATAPRATHNAAQYMDYSPRISRSWERSGGQIEDETEDESLGASCRLLALNSTQNLRDLIARCIIMPRPVRYSSRIFE